MPSYAILSTLVAVVCVVLFWTDCDLILRILPYSTSEKAFTDKVIWITGASSGIGASLAEELTAGGAQIVVSARREGNLEDVANKCALVGKRPMVLPFDVLDFDEHEKAFNKIVDSFGRVDVLVLNPGRTQRALAMDTPIRETRDLFELNYFSYINLAKLVVPTMTSRKSGGQVIILSSIAGKLGTPIASSYSSTKYALHGYFDALRAEVHTKNVNIQLVCPGPVKSEISQNAIRSSPQSATYVEEKKMPTSRCTNLMARAMKWRLDEVWISEQPFLAVATLNTYFPFTSRQLFKYVVGPGRMRTLAAGGDIYNLKNIFGGGH
jgi:dehydrogenase/reductase SDR family member 7